MVEPPNAIPPAPRRVSAASWARFGYLYIFVSEATGFPLAGLMLDMLLGTLPWLMLVGAIAGFGVGFWHLLLNLNRPQARPNAVPSHSRENT